MAKDNALNQVFFLAVVLVASCSSLSCTSLRSHADRSIEGIEPAVTSSERGAGALAASLVHEEDCHNWPAALGKAQRKWHKLTATGPKRFDKPQEAMEFFRQQRLAPGEKDYPIEKLRDALAEIRNRQGEATGSQRRTTGAGGQPQWVELGPGNVGGRTRALLIDPNNSSVLYAAGVAGGIWKSADSGAGWVAADDFMLNLAVTTIVMDPTNSNILYAGTGEGFFNGDAVRGLGIFKSIDAGATWMHLNGTVKGVPSGAFDYVNDIVISPNNPNTIYAGTRSGVWRSVDAGQAWSVILSNPFELPGSPASNGSFVGCTDLAIREDVNPDVIFAAFGSFIADGLFRSTDAGNTWSQLGTEADLRVPYQGRLSLAISPSSNNIIYVCMANNGWTDATGALVDVFRSTDGGNTWSGRVDFASLTGPFLLSNLVYGAGCFGLSGDYAQGWYDNVIAVDPADPNVVWVGGVDLFRSDDGGQHFGIASYWWFEDAATEFSHADQHAILFHPQYDGTVNQVMYVGNDGGVFRTNNARAATSQEACPPGGALPEIAWEELNNGYGVTQFYHGDSSATTDQFGGGTQDNGTLLASLAQTPENWSRILDGDGGYFFIHPADPAIMYAETQGFPTLHKSIDGGATFAEAITGITDEDGLFITPFALDPSNPEVIWTGGSRPWRSMNGAASWSLAGPNFSSGNTISAVAVAPTDSNVVYLGFSNGYAAKSANALGPLPTWTIYGGSNGLVTGAYLSSLAVSPYDSDIVYCTYSTFDVPHVHRSVDGGLTWASIDGSGANGIPDIPAHWIAVRPCQVGQLFVGTELGVFASDDDGSTWSTANAGLANTVVESLDFKTDDDLAAFTHGRGAFLTPLNPCDCNGNGLPDQDEIRTCAGEPACTDCNGNDIPDPCDIAMGFTTDCNNNSLADECEIDCNANSVPDSCDVQLLNLSFSPILGLSPVGDAATSVAAGDLTNDGFDDLAVVMPNMDTVNVFLADGGNTFSPPSIYGVGNNPETVAIADFNLDGHADLVVTNREDNNVSVLLNDGNSSFLPSMNFTVQTAPVFVRAALINADELPDAVVVNTVSNSVSILVNNGRDQGAGWMGFAGATNYSVGSIPVEVDVGDWNGDQSLDLAVVNNISNTVSLLTNDGNGNFVSSGTLTIIGNFPESLAAADLNGDGAIDLAVGTEDDPVTVFLGNGDGVFLPVANVAACDFPQSIAPVDIDGDGDPDLAVACFESDQATLLLNNGNAGFQAPVGFNVGPFPRSIVSGDFDADGRPDIAVANAGSSPVLPVSVLFNATSGGLPDCNGNETPDGCDIASGSSLDADGDGVPDECFEDCNFNGIPDELEADCNSTGVPDDCDVAQGVSQDIDGNNVPDECDPDCNGNASPDGFDLAVGTSPDCNANGIPDECDVAPLTLVFDEFQSITALAGPYAVAAGDLNGDDLGDFAVTYELASAVSIFLSINETTFAAPLHSVLGSTSLDVVIEDIDGDGYRDLVTANTAANSLSVFLNLGDGSFASAQEVSIVFGPRSLAPTDFDLDGDLDLAVGRAAAPRLLLLPNNGSDGNGTWLGFGSPLGYPIAQLPVAILAVLLNNDAHPDVAVLDEPGDRISVFHNQGDGTLGPRVDYMLPSNPKDLTAGDFNNDGSIDLAAVRGQHLILLFNDGAGLFSPPQSLLIGLSLASINAVDLEGDGLMDLAIADRQVDQLLMLRGNGDGTFQAPSGFGVGDDPIDSAACDLDHDGKIDFVTANNDSNDVSVLRNQTPPHSEDDNGNGIPDECECDADLNSDGFVNASDLALLLGAWGPNPGHPADVNSDGLVNASDLALLLGAWGPCG